MKTIIKILLVALFFALIGLGLISCGARKIHKEQSKEQTKTETVDNSIIEKQTDSNIQTSTETKTDDKNEIVTQETIYEPQDSSKESFVIEKDGTKVILNNAKKIVRNTSQKNNTKTELVKKTDELKKESEKEQKGINTTNNVKKETSAKEVDKKQFNPIYWYIGGVIFLILLFIIYRLLKRFKIIP